jgi:hypothetical protein
MRSLTLLLALVPLPAAAACPGGEIIFSCQIGAKMVELCHANDALVYSFGPEGKPELTIAEPLETLDFTPWPGIGRYYWDAVRFRDAGFTYEVYSSIERGPDATTGREAAVTVLDGETEIARLDCDPDTASSLEMIYDLKKSIGQCWDYDSQSWTRTCD